MKQKQSSQQIYDKTVQGIWKILYSHGNVEDFIENPIWSISSDALYYENRNFKKIIENLKNRAHSFTTWDDLINHFNELTEQADWLTLDFIKHDGKIKYKIEFPDNIKRFVVKYDGNKRKQYTTKKIEFPKEIDLNIQLKTVNQDILNKIPVSEHIKRLSSPIIDYIEKGKYITNTEAPISEQHISKTVNNYLENPEKFEKMNTPKTNVFPKILEAADEVSMGVMILLSEMVAVGYGMQAAGWVLDNKKIAWDGADIVQIAWDPTKLFKKEEKSDTSLQNTAHESWNPKSQIQSHGSQIHTQLY